MQIGYISFCDKTAFNIKTQNVKEQILKDIFNISQIKIIQKHFEILNQNHFKKLNDNPHLISLKSNGNPYLLYLTKYNFINTCIFIDKKVQSGYFLPRMIISRFNFSDELFDNTLIEGEMIKNDNKKWIFLINDIYIYKNISLQNKNILKRLEVLNKIFSNFKNDIDDVCLFQINKYFKYDKFNYLVNNYKNSLNYTCRGIYFKPLFYKFKNILFNFDDNLIRKVHKIKYQKQNEFITNNIPNSQTNSQNKLATTSNNYSINKTPDLTYTNDNINNKDLKEFYIENTDLPDVYNLYYINQSNTIDNSIDNSIIKKSSSLIGKFFDIAYIPNIKSSKFIRELFINKPLNTKIIVECILNKNFNKWTPIKVV
tara:strand:+ start:537 stop:1646 length:1110 start_codon:yes stop_codon:yes gene_type:complete